ncbi:MAG: PD40 domain-containing protein, partial [Chloroflexi bacterium]|nr:PD40 domain-containing protein [Chloroflexota bacterium]
AVAAALVGVLLTLVRPWWTRPPEASRHLPVPLAMDGAEFWRVPFMPRQFDFSPDGERIVFAGTNLISIWERKTRTNRRLELRGMGDWKIAGVRGAIAMPRWAPDSRQFVYQAVKSVGGSVDGPILAYALLLVNADTGAAKQIGPDLPEPERATGVCWRPDGTAVTYVFQPRRLMTLSLNGERSLWKDSDLSGAHAVRLGDYSPDGAWLLVSTGNERSDETEDRDIWAMPHLGGASKRLTQGARIDAYPTWGPDGETVYFVSAGGRRESTWGLWKVRVDHKTRLPKGPGTEVFVRKGSRFLHPKFVAGGRTLAYAVAEPKTEVWISGSDAMENGTIAVRGQDPVLSPDGQTIYFVGERPDQEGVFAINRSGGTGSLRKITDLTPLLMGLTSSGLSLSPDGQLLALFGYDGKRHGVFVTPTGGGEPRLIEELPAKDGAVPVWSPDGNWLAYAVDKQLVRTSRDGRVRETLATLPRWQGWSVRWSPDGAHIAAFASAIADKSSEDCGVYVVALADKTLRKLTPDTENQWKEGLEWHPGSEYLTYMIYGPERFSAQTRRAWLDGRPTDLMFDQPDHWDYLGVWAPDGRRFFFTSSEKKPNKELIHLYDAQTTQITHGHWDGGIHALPRWSRDGRMAVWAIGETQRYFELIEDFQ